MNPFRKEQYEKLINDVLLSIYKAGSEKTEAGGDVSDDDMQSFIRASLVPLSGLERTQLLHGLVFRMFMEVATSFNKMQKSEKIKKALGKALGAIVVEIDKDDDDDDDNEEKPKKKKKEKEDDGSLSFEA